MSIQTLTLHDVAQATGGTLLPCYEDRQSRKIAGISTDSRTIAPGEVFFALSGERFDGHDFVPAVLKAGTSAVVVTTMWHREYATLFDGHATFILVLDTLKALQNLAAWYRARFTIPVIGITGSSGKTTAKDMTAAVLAQRYRVLKTPGNLNSQVGLPQILCRLDASHQIAVLEMGMNHTGELARLAAMARPTIGVITNVGPVHLEYLGSLEGVARAKGELLDGIPEDGAVILNADDPLVMSQRHRTRAPVITFGTGETADIRATEIHADLRGTVFRLAGGPAFRLRIAGRHHVTNALVAIAVGRLFDIEFDDIQKALAEVAPAAMRMDYQRIGHIHLINDAYNANPDSVSAALQTLAGVSNGRRIAILGDMLELGAACESAHRQVGQTAAETVDLLITVGDRARHIAEGARQAGMADECIAMCKTNLEATDRVIAWVQDDDVILIKGSRGMHMEEIVSRLEAHYFMNNDPRK